MRLMPGCPQNVTLAAVVFLVSAAQGLAATPSPSPKPTLPHQEEVGRSYREAYQELARGKLTREKLKKALEKVSPELRSQAEAARQGTLKRAPRTAPSFKAPELVGSPRPGKEAVPPPVEDVGTGVDPSSIPAEIEFRKAGEQEGEREVAPDVLLFPGKTPLPASSPAPSPAPRPNR